MILVSILLAVEDGLLASLYHLTLVVDFGHRLPIILIGT